MLLLKERQNAFCAKFGGLQTGVDSFKLDAIERRAH
jgi:hypothetical protein